MHNNDTICAIATASGRGAIAIIRISGDKAVSIIKSIFKPVAKSKDIAEEDSHTLHYGTIVNEDSVIDEVVVSLYRNPRSYTGEDLIEISCHASAYIQQQILQLLIQNGARLATPGEFTLRAFANGKMDLSQAEAVADVIASSSAAAHRLAFSQMRGGYSQELQYLRAKLLDFVSLIELELDFSEEEVEFADRTQLNELCNEIETHISKLVKSFSLGNAIKNGIPVTIVGEPNVGKSTLLNALLNEERAIVSEVPGTTRDVIEDMVTLGGVSFRFIDTAGIRHTTDHVETLGIHKTFEKIDLAQIVLIIVDVVTPVAEIEQHITKIKNRFNDEKQLLLVVNKIDKIESKASHKFDYSHLENIISKENILLISAREKENIQQLEDTLIKIANIGTIEENDVIVTNARHHEALSNALDAIVKVKNGLETGLTNDFLALDIRHVLHYLAEITGGAITNDEMLGNIFKNFCIGK